MERTINEADVFIIVLSEYNFSFPAPIKNALDYLLNEWKYKPVGLLVMVAYRAVCGQLKC